MQVYLEQEYLQNLWCAGPRLRLLTTKRYQNLEKDELLV